MLGHRNSDAEESDDGGGARRVTSQLIGPAVVLWYDQEGKREGHGRDKRVS